MVPGVRSRRIALADGDLLLERAVAREPPAAAVVRSKHDAVRARGVGDRVEVLEDRDRAIVPSVRAAAVGVAEAEPRLERDFGCGFDLSQDLRVLGRRLDLDQMTAI